MLLFQASNLRGFSNPAGEAVAYKSRSHDSFRRNMIAIYYTLIERQRCKMFSSEAAMEVPESLGGDSGDSGGPIMGSGSL